MAFSPDGASTYVTNGVDVVFVLDTTTNAVASTILVDSVPMGVAVSPNGGRICVTNLGSDSVSVIDTATDAVVATIPVGTTPWGVAVSPAGDHVYVSNTAEVPTGAPKENTLCP